MTCIKCGRELVHDDMALHRKMISRAAQEFMCIDCLAAYFKVSVESLREKIVFFREQGCTLFL